MIICYRQMARLLFQYNFCVFTDDLFGDISTKKTTRNKQPLSKPVTLDDDDLFGDPLGGLK